MPAGSPVIVVLVPVPVVVTAPGVLVSVHVPVAGNPFTTMLPVDTVHVGCVMVPIMGEDGKTGMTFWKIESELPK